MKKVIIFGSNSYIGNSFITTYKDIYEIVEVDSTKPLNPEDFFGADVLIHVAAIVHKKEHKKMKHLFYKVNSQLPLETYNLCVKNKVKQFIFFSTMAVYGKEVKIGKQFTITNKTEPCPNTLYGKSKFMAECNLNVARNSTTNLLIIRSPMVYGSGCKGNYNRLLRLAEMIPFVPNIENKRSAISISNLTKFLHYCIENQVSGLYFPQDNEFRVTRDIIIQHKIDSNKVVRITSFFNPLLKFLSICNLSFKKAFGSKVYEIGEKHINGIRF